MIALACAGLAGSFVPSSIAREPAADQTPATDGKTPAAKEPVDYAKLKAVLPESVAGIKRAKASGSKQGTAGMKMSQAEGTYSEDGKETSADINIIDYGGIPGMIEGMGAWLSMDIDNDSDTEMSKTLTVGGYKALETYNKDSKSGNILIVVGKRFWVDIKLEHVDVDALKTAAEAMDLKGLEALAN